jgi:hypothetical protein
MVRYRHELVRRTLFSVHEKFREHLTPRRAFVAFALALASGFTAGYLVRGPVWDDVRLTRISDATDGTGKAAEGNNIEPWWRRHRGRPLGPLIDPKMLINPDTSGGWRTREGDGETDA